MEEGSGLLPDKRIQSPFYDHVMVWVLNAAQ
jgi:hypothetical protein